MSDPKQDIRKIISDVTGVPVGVIGDDFGPGDDPAWDSLAHLNIIIALQSRFGARFDAGDPSRLTSVKAMFEALKDPADG